MVFHLSNVFLKKFGNRSPQIDIFCTKNGCGTHLAHPFCFLNVSETSQKVLKIFQILQLFQFLITISLTVPLLHPRIPARQEVQTYSFPYFFCYFTITHSLNYTSFSTGFPYKNLLFSHSCFIQK